MSDRNDPVVPSLLERESRGGDIGEGGITFQTSVVLSSLPKWMKREGFTSLLREGMGDAEAKFFVPGRGFKKEFVEVKDHSIQPAEFWHEIDRFRQMDEGGGGEYQWFTLASTGLSQSLHPLTNSLRRIRGPHDFYEEGYPIRDNSYEGYIATVEGLGRSREDADFLYRKVLLEHDLSTNRSHGQPVFKQSMRDHLTDYEDMPDRVLADIYAELGVLLQARRNQPIYRTDIEETARRRIPEHFQPPVRPVRILTARSADEPDGDGGELRFDWTDFFGRGLEYPTPEEWNNRVLGELHQAKDWILRHRGVKRIRLNGQRRLSTSLACGWVFSAVSGFSIDAVHRDEVWSTDAHAGSDTPTYPLQIVGSVSGTAGERLVVSLGILHDITSDVERDLASRGLHDVPRIYLIGDDPIVSARQANHLVREAKDVISEALASTGARQLDLYYAGPGVLAVFLGHRLNATAPVQCYERVATGQYVSTCRLSH